MGVGRRLRWFLPARATGARAGSGRDHFVRRGLTLQQQLNVGRGAHQPDPGRGPPIQSAQTGLVGPEELREVEPQPGPEGLAFTLELTEHLLVQPAVEGYRYEFSLVAAAESECQGGCTAHALCRQRA